jgi:DNA processing protein
MQGKSVFAVPGSIFDPLSQGTHALLAQGARLVNSVADIFDEFGDSAACEEEQLSLVPVRSLEPAKKDTSHPLLAHLAMPCSIDELCIRSGQDMVSLQDSLFELQLSGMVRQNFAGLWEAV